MRAAVRSRAVAGVTLATLLAAALAACADGPTIVTIPAPTGTIAGRVLDARTGAPIPGAGISVLPFAPGATTDAEGRFLLEELAVDTEYRVSALKPGYTSSTVEVPVSKGQLFFSVEFTLLRVGP
jgi:hypothetical protein